MTHIIVVAIPHSHTWLWSQTCIASLIRNPPAADGYSVKVIVVNNSPWSPAIIGVNRIAAWGMPGLSVIGNHKSNKFHASALDCVVERMEFDYLMALETDVMALRPGWLQWFLDQMKPTDYAVGMWHHEQFVNPSCTLYRGDILREMNRWCKVEGFMESGNPEMSGLGYCPQDELRWGENFSLSSPLDRSLTPGVLSDPRDLAAAIAGFKEWVAGPFAEKRGFAEGSKLREAPSGQLKGPGWYEPGQQLHHWAIQAGYIYTVCPTLTTHRGDGMPLQTLYGSEVPDPQRQLEAVELFGNAQTAHLWGGTRALDILKHDVTCQFVKANTPMWLAREARFWRQTVPEDVQRETLALIRQYGWHITGQGNDHITDRDRDAAAFVRDCYRQGGVEW